MDNVKKIKNKKIIRTNHQSVTSAKNYTNINKSIDMIFYPKYNSKTAKKKLNLKKRNKDEDNKSKALTNKKLIKVFNKPKNYSSFYDLDDIFNYRQSCPTKQNNNKNSKIITYGRINLKRILKKKPYEINLTNNKNNYNFALDKRNSYKSKKNHSELKNRENNENKQIKQDKINNSKIIKNKNSKINKLIKTNIIHNKKSLYENLNIDTDITEIKDENEIKNKVLRHNTTIFPFEKNNFLFDGIKIEKNNNNNNELLRFSNISKINNNELFYLNNNYNNNITENKISNNNLFINPKIEVNESRELLDEDEKLLEEMSHKPKNKNEQITFTPCLNCNKLINLEEMDEHSNKCFSNTKKNNPMLKRNNNNNNNQIDIIENKLKNIEEYLEKHKKNSSNNINKNIIQELKIIIENIISIKEINSFSIENLSNIDEKIVLLMKKYLNDANIYALLSRIKMLLEEKIQIFTEKNKKIILSEYPQKKFKENSTEENISESETMEFYDLKKILDEKNIKTQNLEKMINDAKNKRLFLMEVLKVKYQKIKENINEDLISPEMLWKEALKQKIEMNNWAQFIFNELSNPNKYLKIISNKNKN